MKFRRSTEKSVFSGSEWIMVSLSRWNILPELCRYLRAWKSARLSTQKIPLGTDKNGTWKKAKKEKKWWRYYGADSISAATCIGIYAGKSGREFNSIFCFWGRQKNIPGILHRSGFTCLGLVEQNYELPSELLKQMVYEAVQHEEIQYKSILGIRFSNIIPFNMTLSNILPWIC